MPPDPPRETKLCCPSHELPVWNCSDRPVFYELSIYRNLKNPEKTVLKSIHPRPFAHILSNNKDHRLLTQEYKFLNRVPSHCQEEAWQNPRNPRPVGLLSLRGRKPGVPRPTPARPRAPCEAAPRLRSRPSAQRTHSVSRVRPKTHDVLTLSTSPSWVLAREDKLTIRPRTRHTVNKPSDTRQRRWDPGPPARRPACWAPREEAPPGAGAPGRLEAGSPLRPETRRRRTLQPLRPLRSRHPTGPGREKSGAAGSSGAGVRRRGWRTRASPSHAAPCETMRTPSKVLSKTAEDFFLNSGNNSHFDVGKCRRVLNRRTVFLSDGNSETTGRRRTKLDFTQPRA